MVGIERYSTCTAAYIVLKYVGKGSRHHDGSKRGQIVLPEGVKSGALVNVHKVQLCSLRIYYMSRSSHTQQSTFKYHPLF